jgi:hypothetical protein
VHAKQTWKTKAPRASALKLLGLEMVDILVRIAGAFSLLGIAL